MQVTFLGTSAMMPTKERNPSAVFLSYKTEGVLFDCGEGTQRQLKIAGININKITRLLLSHMHGDHMLGLPGLVQTLGAGNYNGVLEICCPKGAKMQIEALFNAVVFDFRIRCRITEVWDGIFFEGKDFLLEAKPLHHKIPCVGYAFVEKDKRKIDIGKVKKFGIPEGPLIGELQNGKSVMYKGKKVQPDDVSHSVKGRKLAFITDTVYCKNAVLLAKDADLLICEGTFAHGLEDKAHEYMHLTSREAGQIASQAGAKKLVLTHFSARYKTTHDVEEDAKTVFPEVVCAKDFMRITV